MMRFTRDFVTKRLRPADAQDAVALCLLIVLVSMPLIGSGLPLGVDARFHLYRLVQLDAMWREGIFYSRWQPDLALGYGFPLFNYYAPATYYFAGAWHWLGLSIVASYKLTWVAGIAFAACGSYAWMRQRVSRWAGLIAAVAFAASPYMQFEIVARSGLPQFWANALLPVCFWLIGRAATRGGYRDEAWAAIGLSVAILSHHVAALLAMPFIGLYGLWVYGRYGRWWGVVRPISLAITLTVFYWLPAIGESGLVQIDRATSMTFDHVSYIVTSWRDLFTLPTYFDARLLNVAAPAALSVPVLLLGIFSIGWLGSAENRRHTIGLITLAISVLLLHLLLMLPISEPLWDAVPQLRLIQFPLRFLGVVTLFAAVLAAYGAEYLLQLLPKRTALLTAAMMLLLIGWSVVWSLVERQPVPQLDLLGSVRYEIEQGLIGTTTTGEYLPLDVAELIVWDSAENALAKPIYTTAATVLAEEHTPLRHTMTVQLADSAEILFNTFNFAGWQATLDGRPIAIQSNWPHGLISIQLPAGEHELELWFGSTPLRRVGSTLSALTLMILLLLVARPNAQTDPRKAPATVSITPIVMALAFCIVLRGTVVDCWFATRTRFDGQQVAGVADVRNRVNGSQLQLLAVVLPAPTPADGQPQLSLYWRVLQPLDREYGINLLLLDANGQRVGGGSKIHIGDFQTTRWQPDQYAYDAHQIQIDPGTPPGVYRLEAAIYPFEDPARPIDWLDENGNPAGSRYAIGDVTLTRARASAELAAFSRLDSADFQLNDALSLVAFRPIRGDYQTGDQIPLAFVWQASATVADYPPLMLALSDGTTDLQQTLPLFASEPAAAMQQGDRWRGLPLLRVPPALPSGSYQLEIVTEGDRFEVGTIQVTAPPHLMEAPAVGQLISAEFGPLTNLVGATLPSEVAVGDQLPIELVWLVQSETADNYTTFVQLLDASGQYITGNDQIPAQWQRPTTSWVVGEYVVDPHRLTISAELPAGDYQIAIGIYNTATQTRLMLPNQETTILLPIQVVTP